MQNIKRYILNVVLFTVLLTNLSFADNSNLPDFTKLVEDNNSVTNNKFADRVNSIKNDKVKKSLLE